MNILIVKTYITIVYWYKKLTGKNLKGLGAIQKILKKDFILHFKGKKLYFKPGIEGSYDLLLIGKSNEPETHLFFSKVIPFLDTINFIDIGASVGEMILGVQHTRM